MTLVVVRVYNQMLISANELIYFVCYFKMYVIFYGRSLRVQKKKIKHVEYGTFAVLVGIKCCQTVAWLTNNTLNVFMSPSNMSLSTIQLNDKRNKMSNITFCLTQFIFCRFLNFRGSFPSNRCVFNA